MTRSVPARSSNEVEARMLVPGQKRLPCSRSAFSPSAFFMSREKRRISLARPRVRMEKAMVTPTLPRPIMATLKVSCLSINLSITGFI